MAFDGSTVWLVTAGPRARHAEDFVRQGVMAAGLDLPQVGDLRALDDGDIFQVMTAAERRKPEDDLRELRMFTDRIAVGDVIVTPDTAAADLVFGVVAGEYSFAEEGDLHHVRDVRWFGRLTESQVKPLLVAHTTRARRSVRRLPEQVHWLRLAEEVDDFLGRPADDIPVRARVARRASTRSGGGRGARSAPAKPAPKVVPDRICAMCGLLLAPSMFPDDDDVCRDCA